ncbi:hypothetical protein D3C85_1221840 [compost metagenome]
MQGLHAVDQASRRLAGLEVVEDAPLEEVVAAAGEVVERVRIGAQALAGAIHQIAVARAQGGAVALDHRAARRGDRIEYLIGTVTAYGPVVAIRDALQGVDRRSGRRQVAGGDAEPATQQHGRDRAEDFAAAVLEGRADPVGEARRAAGRAARVRELPGIAEAVAEYHHGRVGRRCRL